MKIVLTGGASGGHFYPLIAVAEELRRAKEEENLVNLELHFIAPDPYDERVLFEHDIIFHRIRTGKLRRYFSWRNIIDIPRSALAAVKATFILYRIFPDVVFSKGGHGSFPTVFAARVLRIPVFIHESDSTPGRANVWAGKFARRIAVSWEETLSYFPKEKTALVGNPVRREMFFLHKTGAHEFLHLEEGTPTVLILGGSQGAKIINETILDALPSLVSKCQVIHQTGENNYEEVSGTASVILENNEHKSRYHPFPYLNKLALKMSAGIADLIVSRAGGTIFEIAVWNVPAVLIPITSSNGDHQRKNAFTYAKAGAAIVIEESNLRSNVLVSEISSLLDDEKERERMGKNAKVFAKPEAAEKIAHEIIELGLEHEK